MASLTFSKLSNSSTKLLISSALGSKRFLTSSKKGLPLNDKTAIVTASTEGIGLAISKRLAQDGANVVISSRKEVNVTRAVAKLKEQYPNQIDGMVCHVGKEDDREKLVEFAMEKFGRLNIFVSNAAVNPYFGSFIDTDESQWDKIFDTNVKAPFMFTKKVVTRMLKNSDKEKGCIIYVSSIAAYTGIASIGAYSVSKTALLGLTKNMANELGVDGIRVNLVAPGIIKTKFSEALWQDESQMETFITPTALKRLGEPDEIAGVVNFLCGPEASYITGENIVVAGGMHGGL